MISMELLFSIIILSGGMPILASFLRAKHASLSRIYLILVGLITTVIYVALAAPKGQLQPDRCWFYFLEYCMPVPWVLLMGFAVGNFIFLCLWLLIKYGEG